jgi:hypothetical protein
MLELQQPSGDNETSVQHTFFMANIKEGTASVDIA